MLTCCARRTSLLVGSRIQFRNSIDSLRIVTRVCGGVQLTQIRLCLRLRSSDSTADVRTPNKGKVVTPDLHQHRTILTAVSDSLRLDGFTGWYQVHFRDLSCVYGARELVRSHYSSNVGRAVTTTFPEHPWLPWLFDKLPKDYWEPTTHVVTYLNWLGSNSLSVRRHDDWYQVTTLQLRKQKGGSSLLRKFNFSMIKLLEAAYPDHHWEPTKFAGGPGMRYWFNTANQRTYMDTIARELGIRTRQDWRNVSSEQILRFQGASRILELHGRSLQSALDELYGPET